MAEWITMSELARRLELSRPRVNTLTKQGNFDGGYSSSDSGKRLFEWPKCRMLYNQNKRGPGSKVLTPPDADEPLPADVTAIMGDATFTSGMTAEDIEETNAKLPSAVAVKRVHDFIKMQDAHFSQQREQGLYVLRADAIDKITSEYSRIQSRVMSSARPIAEATIHYTDVEDLREALEKQFRLTLEELGDPNDIR